MKKALSFVIIFLILLLTYQFIIIFFEKSHKITYKLLASEKEFEIIEEYRKNDDEDGYFLNIKHNNNQYVYYIKNNYNKQKKVIKDIKYYEKDNYLCIYPVTQDHNIFEILCSDEKEIYSFDYINKKIDISEFLTQLKIQNYYATDEINKIEKNGIYFYKNNFYENEYLSLYHYKNLDIYNSGEINSYNFSDQDIYQNDLGVYIDEFFLIPIIRNNKIQDKYLIVDSINSSTKTIYFDELLSNKIYNIGVVDKKLYIFDLINKTEYEINTNGTYQVIGNEEKGFKKYKDGEWVNASITEFTQEMITFSDEKINIELDFSYDNIYETQKHYYILENNKVYKIYKKDLTKRILLFEISNNYNNLLVNNDRIYFIIDKYLYRYDQYGSKRLIENNDFKFNNQNIYCVYNK